jgi:V8-like Glu-specific endopeptidase
MTKGQFSTARRFAPIRSYVTVVDRKMGSCTGAFITKRHLLTAAHCLEFVAKGGWVPLFLGTFPFNASKSLRRENLVTTYRGYVHPSFLKNGVLGESNDVAVIEFLYDMGDAVLPIDFNPVAKGERLVTTGYGCDKATKIDGNDFQIGAELVASLSDQRIFLKKIETLMCPGDSGGPVLKVGADQSVSIVGINSYFHPVQRFLGRSGDRVARLDDQAQGDIRAWLTSVTSGTVKPTYEINGF